MNIKNYFELMRLNKPIGIFLLLWPTLSALWLASPLYPSFFHIFIFTLGVIIMRSAGCIINDIADRKIDVFVVRTQDRPITSGKMSVKSALYLFFSLIFAAFMLVLLLNPLTIQLSFLAAGLAILYPFLKRITYFPQLGLGMAFAFGVPMAFAAETNDISKEAWLFYAIAVLWPIIYDTLYAMVDREEDIKIGVKSTAIWFGKYDKTIIGFLQIILLLLLFYLGKLFNLNNYFNIAVFLISILFFYQQLLISQRNKQNCFKAFLNNNLVGFILLMGIVFGKLT